MAVGGSGNDPGGSGSGGFGPGAGGGWGGGANNNQGSGGSMGSSGSGPSGGGGWGGHGGGGGGGGGGNSGNGSNVGTAAAEAASKGRRESASTSFGGFVDAATDAAKGLATGVKEGIQNAPGAISDAAKDIGRTVSNAMGLNKGMTELGEQGWKGPGHMSRNLAAHKGLKRGAEKAMNEKGLATVGSVVGLTAPATGIGKLGTIGMTADEQRGYDATKSQATGLAGPAGLATSVTGVPGLTTMAHAVDYGKMAGFAQSEYGLDKSTSKGRRDSATQSFSGGGSKGPTLASSTAAAPSVPHWQPSSIGFGNYDSALKGLLS